MGLGGGVHKINKTQSLLVLRISNLIGEDRINSPERLTNVTRKSAIKYLVSVAESKYSRNFAVGWGWER